MSLGSDLVSSVHLEDAMDSTVQAAFAYFMEGSKTEFLSPSAWFPMLSTRGIIRSGICRLKALVIG